MPHTFRVRLLDTRDQSPDRSPSLRGHARVVMCGCRLYCACACAHHVVPIVPSGPTANARVEG